MFEELSLKIADLRAENAHLAGEVLSLQEESKRQRNEKAVE